MHFDKKLIFFLFSIVFELHSFSFYNSSIHSFCDGNLCTKNCSNCNLCIQQENCFIEENCYCPSVGIPGNLSLEDTPQFIFFTFDDAIPFDFFNNNDFLRDLFQNQGIKDSNGCFLRPTFFAQSRFTDFGMVAWFEKIGEISLHTTTHSTNKSTAKDVWIKEFGTVGNNMRYLGSIHDIRGARAPFLQFNDDYFDTLKFLNLAYDSSGSFNYKWNNYELPSFEQKNYWPFTLDFGFPRKSMCENGICPNKTHPGVWEFLMNGWMKGSFEQILMDYIIDKNSLSDFIKDFDDNYSKNRAPLGFFFHVAWLEDLECLFDKTKKKFLIDLLSYIVSKPNIVFATPYRVIQWMKNPKDIRETLLMKEFQCINETIKFENSCSDGKSLKQCCFPRSHFFVCGEYCPNLYPDLDANWQFLGSNETIDHSIYLINNLDELSNQTNNTQENKSQINDKNQTNNTQFNDTNQTNNTQENKSKINDTTSNATNDTHQNYTNDSNIDNNNTNQSIINDTNKTTVNDTANNNNASIDNNNANQSKGNDTSKTTINDTANNTYNDTDTLQNDTNNTNIENNKTNQSTGNDTNMNNTTNNTINGTHQINTNNTNIDNNKTNQSIINNTDKSEVNNTANNTINDTHQKDTNSTNIDNNKANQSTGNDTSKNSNNFTHENFQNSTNSTNNNRNNSINNNYETNFNNSEENSTDETNTQKSNANSTNNNTNKSTENETQQNISRILLQSKKLDFLPN